jgi:hypothetical protein
MKAPESDTIHRRRRISGGLFDYYVLFSDAPQRIKGSSRASSGLVDSGGQSIIRSARLFFDVLGVSSRVPPERSFPRWIERADSRRDAEGSKANSLTGPYTKIRTDQVRPARIP